MACACCGGGGDCETDEDCPEGCAEGHEETPKFDGEGNVIEGVGGCCPPGFPFDPVTRLCGGSSSPSPPISKCCCEGECLPCVNWLCVAGVCVEEEHDGEPGTRYCSEAVCEDSCGNEFP